MSYVSAKAQMSSPFLAEMVKNANKYIGAEALQPSMFDPFVSSKEEKRERFITQYVKTDTLTGKFVLLATKPGGGFDTVKMEQTLVVNLVNVRKLTGNSAYNGLWAPLYAFDPDMDDPRMLIVMSYKKGEAVQSVQQAQTLTQGNEPNSTQTGNGVKTMPDGTMFGPGFIRLPDGTMLFQQSNGSYLTAQQMTQGGAQGGVQASSQTNSQDGATAGSANPMRFEPEVRYYQDESGKSVPYYVSAEGHIMRLTDPNTPKQFDVDGVNVVYAINEAGVWAPTFTDKRNGYKYGVGEYAGFRGNYYRDAANGAPLGTGNVRALGVVGGVQPAYMVGNGCGFGPSWYNQLQVVSQPRVTGGMPQWTNYGPRFMNPNALR